MHIPIENCEHNRLYRLSSRNLTFGVFDEKNKSFIGIRQKFGDRFLDSEYHGQLDFGTAYPKEALEMCPCDQDAKDDGLFVWLDQFEKAR